LSRSIINFSNSNLCKTALFHQKGGFILLVQQYLDLIVQKYINPRNLLIMLIPLKKIKNISLILITPSEGINMYPVEPAYPAQKIKYILLTPLFI